MTKPFFNFNDVAFLGESSGSGAVCLDPSVEVEYDFSDPDWIFHETSSGPFYVVTTGETAALRITTNLPIPGDITPGYTLHYQTLSSATIDGAYSVSIPWTTTSMDAGFFDRNYSTGDSADFFKLEAYLTKGGCPDIGSEGSPFVSDIFSPGSAVCPSYIVFDPNGGTYDSMLSQNVLISSSLGALDTSVSINATVEKFNGLTWDFFANANGSGVAVYVLTSVGTFRIKATATKDTCPDTPEFISATYTVT